MRSLLTFLILLNNIQFLFSKLSTPPRGWNSWDSYKGCINENQVLASASAVAKYLKPFGYEYIVIDGGWHHGIDTYGRPQPDTDKFPHSSNGTGFKWLSQQINAMGLKLGVWDDRGIQQQAIDENSPIYGTNNKIHIKDIVNMSAKCPWGQSAYALKMNTNGSQQFYNSLYSQFAEWGIDFIKNDCSFASDFIPDNINGVYKAMENSKHEFIYSLSPGGDAEVYEGTQIGNITNMYRITHDTWDNWVFHNSNGITEHFQPAAQFAGNIDKPGIDGGKSFPDLDMLPLGYITVQSSHNCSNLERKWTSLKKGEQRCVFTLWCMARSPLIFGGDPTKLENDSFTLDLITNQYGLAVNSNSTNNKEIVGIYNKNNSLPEQIIWAADGSNNDYYVAFFNIDSNNNNQTLNMSVSFDKIGINNSIQKCSYIEAWTNRKGETSNRIVETVVKPNDTALIYLNSCN